MDALSASVTLYLVLSLVALYRNKFVSVLAVSEQYISPHVHHAKARADAIIVKLLILRKIVTRNNIIVA